jgi:hypothetical protein
MTESELEEKVIQTLVSCPPTEDRWRDPIHAVDRAVGNALRWSSEDTRNYVRRLIDLQLIVERTEVVKLHQDPAGKQKWWWERASA